MNLKEIECEDVDWTHMGQDKAQWWVTLKIVMDLRNPENVGNFTSWETISVSRRSIHSICYFVSVVSKELVFFFMFSC
jgi:hypothetical protein